MQVQKIENEKFNLTPRNLTEAQNLAKIIANSSFCPTAMKGKDGDILVAMQFGFEVGLSPMQALQNVAVINGRPCIWGDASLAVARSNPNFESIHEWIEGSIEKGDAVAYCRGKRKGEPEVTRSFSIDDAKKAGLWGKSGPWSQYPKRMLQMRARAFCLRDTFTDSLRGMNIREEIEDIQPVITVSNKEERQAELKNRLLNNLQATPAEIIDAFDSIKKEVERVQNLDELDALAEKTQNLSEENKLELRKIWTKKSRELKSKANEELKEFFKEGQ